MEYRFRIFSSGQKSRYTRLSNCGPLSDTIDFGMPNRQIMFFHIYEPSDVSVFDGCVCFSLYPFAEVVRSDQ